MSGGDRPIAVVTGGGRGIGAAVAARLVEDGYGVWSLSRTPGADTRVHHAPCDLADAEAADAAIAGLAADLPRIDLVVANAAVRNLSPVGGLSMAAWRAAVEVNLSSVVTLLHHTLPALRARRGRVIVVGSHAGTHPFEGGATYCATKAALKALVEVLLLEERPHGVRTTLISPGATANLAGDVARTKLAPSSVADAVSWSAHTPEDLVVGELEIRPALLPEPAPVWGFDRLQAV